MRTSYFSAKNILLLFVGFFSIVPLFFAAQESESSFERLLLSDKPSLVFRWLAQDGYLKEILPELAVLQEVEQHKVWHPEGSVFEHTMQVLDAAAALQMRTKREKLILMYAALCHDFGKYFTTRPVNGVLRCHGHADAGVEPAKKAMHRLTNDEKIIEAVCCLVKNHMKPWDFVEDNEGPCAYQELAENLSPPVDMFMLRQLSCADRQGRHGGSHEPFKEVAQCTLVFEERAKDAGVYPQFIA